jgi:hypothetical protein
MEPFRLKRWKIGSAHFFTCARPGRSKCDGKKVPDDIVHRWVKALPGPMAAIVSLLGRKHGPKGTSEFSFYSFCGGFDTPSERRNCLSFQDWLDKYHKSLHILVRKYPTYDYAGQITAETMAAVASDIHELIAAGRTPVLVDSGGMTRTGIICKDMGATEDSRTE